MNYEIIDKIETSSFFDGNYFTCMRDTKWWIELIINVFEEVRWCEDQIDLLQ